MRLFYLFILLPILLFSLDTSNPNPRVYTALGDVIYNNVDKIEKLKDIPLYYSDDMIDKYVDEVYTAKEIGFAIERGTSKADPMDYLKRLRKLSKTNDFFVRDIEKKFKQLIKKEDSWLLNQVINSGLLDVKKYKKEIMEYYASHSDKMSPDGVIQQFIDEEAKKHKDKKVKYKKGPTREELKKEKIRRLRERDRKKQEALQKALEEEVKIKKLKIRQEQLKELQKSN